MATEWREEFNLGIPQIDVQHREYVALVGKIEHAIRIGAGADDVERFFKDVESYIQIHFAAEESLFEKFGCYPQAAAHKEAHRRFADGVQKLRAAFVEDPTGAGSKAVILLQEWLYDHILLMDKGYVSCFKKNGL